MAGMTSDDLGDFTSAPFSFAGETKPVFRKGTGPAVVVMTEMPGITPAVADFSRRVVDRGFSVWLPSLFGTPGRAVSNGYIATSLARGCISKEFVAFARGRTSPITTWLRSLARHAWDERGGPGVGVVGMCFSGGFALGMLADHHILVPVLSQPSLPFAVGERRKQDLGVDDADLAVAKARVDDGLCVIGLRFTADPLVPVERFDRLRHELGEGFIGVEIDSSPGNPQGFDKRTHSVLGEAFVDEPGHPTRDAFETVIAHFERCLR